MTGHLMKRTRCGPSALMGHTRPHLRSFVHSYGLGQSWPICALRPTGIYGLAYPAALAVGLTWCAR